MANTRTYIQLLRTDLKSKKVQILSEGMRFSPQEASVFWPIYKNYDAELSASGDRRIALIEEYVNNYNELTDAKADELVKQFLSVKSQRDAALRRCYDEVRQKMGGKTAARFFQAETQLLLLVDLKVASMLPAIE